MRNSAPPISNSLTHDAPRGVWDFDPYQQWLGIEPHARPLDHYTLLGVRRFENDPAAISAAADDRMALVRKQQTGPRGAFTQSLLNELAAARVCLLDPADKDAYDAALEQELSIAPALQTAAPQPAEPPIAADTQAAADGEPLDDDDRPAHPIRTAALAALAVVAIAAAVWSASEFWLSRDAQSTSPHRPQTIAAATNLETPPHAADETIPVVIGQETTGEVHLPASVAQIQGQTARCETRDGESFIVDWTDVGDSLAWRFDVTQPGVFRIEISYYAAPESVGGRYQIAVGQQSKNADVRSGAAADELVTDFYFLAVRRAGENTLVMRPLQIQGGELMQLRAIRLVPQYTTGGG